MASRQSVQNHRRRNGNKISRTILQPERSTENHTNGQGNSLYRTPVWKLLRKQIYQIYIRNTVYSHSYRPSRAGRTYLKKNLLTNIKAGEPFGKTLDLALNVMRNTPHTRLRKTAFELHFGREPNTE